MGKNGNINFYVYNFKCENTALPFCISARQIIVVLKKIYKYSSRHYYTQISLCFYSYKLYSRCGLQKI